MKGLLPRRSGKQPYLLFSPIFCSSNEERRKRSWEQTFFTILEESNACDIQHFTRSSLRGEIKGRLNENVSDKKSENQWIKGFINQYICSRNLLVFLLIDSKKHFIKAKPSEITLSLIHNMLETATPNENIGCKMSYKVYIENIDIKSDSILQSNIQSRLDGKSSLFLYINIKNISYRKRTITTQTTSKQRKLTSTPSQHSERIPSSVSSLSYHESKVNNESPKKEKKTDK